jgi:hypothetical protein
MATTGMLLGPSGGYVGPDGGLIGPGAGGASLPVANLYNRYALKVDWDNDGDFDDALEDCSDRLIAVQYSRGRDGASPLRQRAGPASLRAVLLNTDGRYSPLNAGSPLHGSLEIGRPLRFDMLSPLVSPRWYGFVKAIRPYYGPYVEIEAQGGLGTFVHKISPPAKPSGTASGTVVGAILDAAGWPASKRTLDAGQINLGRWYVEGMYPVAALREVEDTELGFVYDGLSGYIVFEGRFHRLSGSHLVSSAVLSDDPSARLPYLSDIELIDPDADLFNYAEAQVPFYSVAGAADLWTYGGANPVLPPGGSLTVIAQYPPPSAPAGAYVETWTTPVYATDVVVSWSAGGSSSDLAISVVKQARRMRITLTNNHGSSTATITTLKARGTAVTIGSPVTVFAEDAASQATYGIRSHPSPGKWFANIADAQSNCGHLVNVAKDRNSFLRLSYTAVANPHDGPAMLDIASLLGLNISDRVTVVATGVHTQFGLNADYFVERIEESIQWGESPAEHRITLYLSPVQVSAGSLGAYFILDTSTLDNAALGF